MAELVASPLRSALARLAAGWVAAPTLGDSLGAAIRPPHAPGSRQAHPRPYASRRERALDEGQPAVSRSSALQAIAPLQSEKSKTNG
jgi:hypothetical protein